MTNTSVLKALIARLEDEYKWALATYENDIDMVYAERMHNEIAALKDAIGEGV